MIFNVGDSQKVLERARKLYGEGKIDRAIKTIERSLSGGKADFPLYLELAKYNFERSKFVETATNLKRAYVLIPEKWEQVIDTIESAHFAGGTPEETGILLIEIYLDKDLFEEARKIIDASTKEQVEEMSNRYTSIYNNVISKKEIKDLTKKDILHIYALSLLKQKINLNTGLDYYENIYLSFPDEQETLLKDLERVCRSFYGNPYPQFMKGKLLFFSKRYDEALRYFIKAVNYDKRYTDKVLEIIEEVIGEEKSPILLRFLAEHQIAIGNTEKAVMYAEEMEKQKDIPPKDIIKIYTEVIRKDSKNIDVRLALVRLYAKEGKYDPVLSELTSIIELNPEKFDDVTRIAEEIIEEDPYNSNLLYFLSDLYIQKGDPDKAISSLGKLFKANKEFASEIIEKLNKVLEKDFNNIKGLSLIGSVYTYKKKYEEALLIFNHLMDQEGGFEYSENGIRKIAEENPDNINAKISLGLIEFKKGNHKVSLEIINSVVEEDPSNVTQLIPQLDSIARKSPELAPYVLKVYESITGDAIEPFVSAFAKAEAYSIANDYSNAVTFYNKCFEIQPEFSDKVIDGIQRILEKKEDIPEVNFALATLYLKTDKPKEGLQYLRRANELDHELSDKIIHILYNLFKKFPNEPAITVELLRALMNKGAYEQVIKECEEAIEKIPKEKTGPIYLIHGHASLEKGLLKQAALSIVHALDIDETLAQEALALLLRALNIEKNNVVVKYALAKASIVAKKYSDAAFYFYDITKNDPTKIGKAIEELKKIVKLDRVNPDIHFSLGSLFLTEKRLKDAIVEFRAVSELSDSYTDKVIGKLHYIAKHNPVPEVHLNLGELYLKKRMLAKATHHLLEACRKDSSLIEQAALHLNKIKVEDPENIAVLYALAELAEKENDLRTAISHYDKILSIVPDEIQTVRKKVEVLLEEHEEEIEHTLFLAKIFSFEGKTEESIKILREIIHNHPDKAQSVMNLLTEMSERGETEATLSLLEFSLENNRFDETISLLERVENHFSYHNRIIELLNQKIPQDINHTKLIIHLIRFFYFKEEWDLMRDLISRGLTVLDGESSKFLTLYNYLLLSHEGKETDKIEKRCIKEWGKKKFYKLINTLEQSKKEFQLKRIRFARNKSPDVSSLIFEEVELLVDLGYDDEAIQILTKPFGNKKDRIYAKYLTAQSFLNKKNPVRSIEILRTVPLPHDAELKNKILLLLSTSYEKIGDFKSALISLKSCEPDIRIEKRIAYLNEMTVHSNIKGGNPIISA
jgi:tetratricopeptide (TPR) repeat protein